METITKEFAIVVVNRGFVYVGDVEINEKYTIISNARNIRYWGTTRGLGELVLHGPTDKTKLNDCGIVRVPAHQVISIHDTEQSKWN